MTANFRGFTAVLALGILIPAAAIYYRNSEKSQETTVVSVINSAYPTAEDAKSQAAVPSSKSNDSAQSPTDKILSGLRDSQELVSNLQFQRSPEVSKKEIDQRWAEFKKKPGSYEQISQAIQRLVGEKSADRDIAALLNALALYPDRERESSLLIEQARLKSAKPRLPANSEN